MTVYDTHFNQNEWFVLIVLVLGYLIVWKIPRRFNLQFALVFVLYGIFVVHFFDHTISLKPFNYYDVNDNSSYQWFDFLSYVMYGPFSYIFIYVYDKYINNKYKFLYIFGWSILAISIEWIAHLLGLYHYRKGFTIFYSFIIYLGVQSICLLLYYQLKSFKK